MYLVKLKCHVTDEGGLGKRRKNSDNYIIRFLIEYLHISIAKVRQLIAD